MKHPLVPRLVAVGFLTLATVAVALILGGIV